jgi:hypothetical protein
MSNLGNRGISLHYISTTLFRREVASIQEKTEKTGGFHSSASETYHRNTEHGLAAAGERHPVLTALARPELSIGGDGLVPPRTFGKGQHGFSSITFGIALMVRSVRYDTLTRLWRHFQNREAGPGRILPLRITK